MAQDSTIPATDAEVPAEADTTEQAAGDTDANTPQVTGAVDWENRYKASQAELTRKSQALARLQIEAQAEPVDEEGDEPVQRRRAARASQREAELEAQNAELQWTIARSVYPEDVIDAYASAAQLLEQAQTAADYVGAFEAYHQSRSQGASPQQAAAAARQPTPSPRIEAPRTEPDLTGLNNKAAEAAKKHDLAGWAGALLRGE